MTCAHPSSTSVLCSAGHPLAGFLRFLQLLGTHTWQERPLVIGSAQELPPAQRSTLANLFTAGRRAGTLPAVVLATAKDPQGTAWTQRGPSGDVWRRLVLLARRGLQALQVNAYCGQGSPRDRAVKGAMSAPKHTLRLIRAISVESASTLFSLPSDSPKLCPEP